MLAQASMGAPAQKVPRGLPWGIRAKDEPSTAGKGPPRGLGSGIPRGGPLAPELPEEGLHLGGGPLPKLLPKPPPVARQGGEGPGPLPPGEAAVHQGEEGRRAWNEKRPGQTRIFQTPLMHRIQDATMGRSPRHSWPAGAPC